MGWREREREHKRPKPTDTNSSSLACMMATKKNPEGVLNKKREAREKKIS